MSEGVPLIAVVDDEVSVCRALDRLLRSAGYEVVTFTQGAAFLEYLETREVDCAVLDLHMPQMGGVEIQGRLRDAGKRVPVVVVTGHDTPESQRRVMEGGAVAYLRKPADEAALVEAVERGIREMPGEHFNTNREPSVPPSTQV